MRTHIMRIGNSFGIRIPKTMLEETGLIDQVVLTVAGRLLVVSPVLEPREGWNAEFAGAAMDTVVTPCNAATSPDEASLMEFIQNSFEDREWEWK